MKTGDVRVRWAVLLALVCGTWAAFPADGDAEYVVLPSKFETRSARDRDTASLSVAAEVVNPAVASGPRLVYEFRYPSEKPGQAAGFRIEVTQDNILKIAMSFVTNAGQRSAWGTMLEQPADREALETMFKWMEKKKLDAFDARAAAEKCAESGKSVYADSVPNELLSVRLGGCKEPKLIYWRDLPNEARQFTGVAEVQTLNAALNEVVLFAANACPEKSVLRVFLKRE